MRLPVQFLAEANAEFAASAEWYDQQRAGLGADFLAKVRGVIEQIAESPQSHAAIYGEVRKAAVPRFPYVVLYREEAGQILVISIFYTARDPSTWKSRA